MGIPLYLAVTAGEMNAETQKIPRCAWMACHFSSSGKGLSNFPKSLPPHSMIILNDRYPCQGHSPELVSSQMAELSCMSGCERILLDLQRMPEPETRKMADTILSKLSCPAAITERYAKDSDIPVFLSMSPLHVSLQRRLERWNHREIWLEASLCQEQILVTNKGCSFHPQFPTDSFTGGFFDEALQCHYKSRISDSSVEFTLFDTIQSLNKKMYTAEHLGVQCAVGLYQELGSSLHSLRFA